MIQFLEYSLFRLLVLLLAILPFPLLIVVSQPLYWLLYRVFRYRRKVVDRNLKQAFPEKKEAELARIRKAYYHQLADVLVETIKGLSMKESEFRRRYQFRNTDIFEALYKEGKSAIIAGGHFANWEWGSFSFPLWVDAAVVGIYKPVKNPYLEKFLQNRRRRWGLHLAPMAKTGRALVQYRQQTSLFVLIADQSPSNLEAAHWLPFFYRETPFLNGLDKIARNTDYPVYYFDIKRLRRGFYEIEFRLLCEHPKTMPEGTITQLFRDELERDIRRQPELWLWSHRRWKRAR